MTIEERLEALERELENTKLHVRRLWVGLGLAVLVCALVWGFTATTGAAKGIRANRFIVVDENGKTRVALSATEDGPKLKLFDDNGKVIWHAP